MRHYKILVCLLCLSVLTFFVGCSKANTVIKMEIGQNYDYSEPYINEKLFYVQKDIDHLQLFVSINAQAENIILEIANNESGEAIYSEQFTGNLINAKSTIDLYSLLSSEEYVIRLVGTGVSNVKIVITSDSSLVRERERPLKPKKA